MKRFFEFLLLDVVRGSVGKQREDEDTRARTTTRDRDGDTTRKHFLCLIIDIGNK